MRLDITKEDIERILSSSKQEFVCFSKCYADGISEEDLEECIKNNFALPKCSSITCISLCYPVFKTI